MRKATRPRGTDALDATGALQAAAEHALLNGGKVAPPAEAGAAATEAYAMLGLASEAAAVDRAIRGAANMADVTAARAALRDLQGKIGDHSNLILDNVLKTYYLTDVVLNRLPDLLDRLTDIGALAAAQGGSADARANFLIALGGFEAVTLQKEVTAFLVSLDEATDRRGFQRFAVDDMLEITTAEGEVLRAQAVDLGRGGLLARGEATLAVGAPVTAGGLPRRPSGQQRFHVVQAQAPRRQ